MEGVQVLSCCEIVNNIDLWTGTLTGNALYFLRDNVLLEERGMRPFVPKNIVLFTDGKSRDDVEGISAELKGRFNV